MAEPAPDSSDETDYGSLLLLVVGAHLRAEVADRPLAYGLRERILRWMDQHATDPLVPVVCTDVWYLNSADLRQRPTVAIGGPEVNAASAYLANRLPTAFVIEQTLRIHLDQEFIDLDACLWGSNPGTTGSAVDLFVERYLDGFLRAAHGLSIGR